MNDNNDTFFLPEYSYKILKSIAKSEKIEDFKISTTDGSSKGENFLGVISRVKIEGIKNGKKENVYLILKTPPVFDKSIRDKMLLNAYYRREVYAYNVVLPAFSKVEDEASILEEDKFKSAKCFTATSDDMSEILVFEDLNVQGFKMFNRHESFDYDHMLLIVRTLAKYHALSFAMKERYPKKFSQFSDNIFKKEDLGDVFSKMYYESVDKAIGMMENSHLAERLRAYAKDSYEKLADFLVLPDDSEDTKYGVIGHGDCWCNNFLFKYEENKPTSVILVDWQIIKFASPVIDLAYLIFTSTDEEFRSEHFDDIMDVYYDSLSARLSLLGCDARQCFPEEIFKQHQRKYLLSGLLMSIIVLPLSQGNKSEAVDLTDMIGANEMNTDKIIVSDDCVRRLNGVVKDFVKYGLI